VKQQLSGRRISPAFILPHGPNAKFTGEKFTGTAAFVPSGTWGRHG